jgi:hypothetical protein
MEKIHSIVENIDLKLMKENYINTKNLIDEVGKFIIKKKLMIYGGLALNLLLSKKDKFYKIYTVNDYDCFSKNAKDDAIELATILSKKGYKYIKVRKALHENTFKVYADFNQIFDITQLSPATYDSLYKLSEDEKKTPLYKYYKDKYKLAPYIFLKSNLHFELARPISSYYRWEKVYLRLLSINKLLKLNYNSPTITKSKEQKIEIPKKILKYIKDNKLPIIGVQAFKHHNIYYNQDNTIDILSNNITKTLDSITKILKDDNIIIKHYKKYLEIYPEHYKIYNDKYSIKIININNECFSYINDSNYIIGSIDTILYFLYRQYILEYIYNTDNNLTRKLIIFLEEYLNMINIPVDKRLSDKCYGDNFTLKDVLIKKWKKKQTLKYI